MSIAALFDGWDETMIWSCLQGHMGSLTVAGQEPELAARITVGDFSFFAGTTNEFLIKTAISPILVPRTPDWSRMIENVWGDCMSRAFRYTTLKETDGFDKNHLEALVRAVPETYELKEIDASLYDEILRHDWSKDLCSQFLSAEDYLSRGVGFAALNHGSVVAGASSYTVYTGGIEIEIDTDPAYRRRGLAAGCGARLILECLDRGLYPSWDAHDPRSLALAEKLGYHRGSPYPVYIVKDATLTVPDAEASP